MREGFLENILKKIETSEEIITSWLGRTRASGTGKTRLVDARKQEGDIGLEHLRPKNWTAFIGQEHITRVLRVALQAAAARNEALDHCLFVGAPGLGKTTLAKLCAPNVWEGIGRLMKPGQLTSQLLRADRERFPAIFLDEFHALKPGLTELLTRVMEDFELMLPSGKKKLKKFTLFAATTRAGDVAPVLTARFGFIFFLLPYTLEELTSIANNACRELNLHLDAEGLREVAKRSRGIPRICNRLLKRIRDFSSEPTLTQLREIFAELGIDELGLDHLERRYLKVLAHFKDQPIGLNNLSAMIGEEEKTIAEIIEPYLIQLALVTRTPKGRLLTEKGLAWAENGKKLEG